MKGRTISLLFLTLGLSLSSANIRDSISDCTDGQFLQGIVQCIALKFEPLLPQSQFSPHHANSHHYNTGRHTLSFHEPKDMSIRQNYVIPQISKHLSDSHRKLLNHMEEVGKAVLDKEYEVMAIERLRQVDFQQEIEKYMTDILSHVAPFTRQETGNFHVEEEEANDRCNSICRLFPQFCAICDVLPQQYNVIECLSQYTQEDFEDSIQWMKCLYTCEDLIPMSGCLQEQFSQCGKWSVMSDVVIRAFADFTGLDSCLLNVEMPDNVTLSEGGGPIYVNFHNYLPPGAHCVDLKGLSEPLGVLRALGTLLSVILGNTPECSVKIEMSTQNFWNNLIPHIDRRIPPVQVGRPKCANKDAIRQAVIGNHEHASNGNTGVINITAENWNETHTVPIWPSVDLKHDGDVTTNFTIKLRVGNQVKFNAKIPVTVEDNDIEAVSLCQSTGDPHITTFDGHYYNNLYDGYFYLYRSTESSSQIQVAYQRCISGGTASCTCAVAVKIGDDVFVVDKCRRTEDSETDPQMKAVLFTNGELTAGTRIFLRSQGSEFRVILPTGAKLDITVVNSFLNVFFTPSTYDWENTEGLCGVFDGDSSNDLQLPGGGMYQGPGTGEGEQPRNFTEAWRVPADQLIFEGVLPLSLEETGAPFCTCNQRLMRSVECVCGDGEIVETCDDDLNGELYNVSALIRISKKTVESGFDIDMDGIDIDESFQPPEIDWSDNTVWNETAATDMCNSLVDSENSPNLLISGCKSELLRPGFLSQAELQCVQDIQITDTDNWKWSAVESAKRKCYGQFLRGIDLDENTFTQYQNYTCLNDCTNRGTCAFGECHCESGWTSGDCSVLSSSQPVVTMSQNSKCDTRHEDCQYATIYGRNFPSEPLPTCRVQEAEVDGSGNLVSKGDSHEVGVMFISPYQLVCMLPSSGSFYIDLEVDGVPVAVQSPGKPQQQADGGFAFIAYDSACYVCDSLTQSCTTKAQDNSYCIIENQCYQQNETNSAENCQYCDGMESSEDWSWIDSDACDEVKAAYDDEEKKSERDRNIRISVASVLTALIVVLTVILYIFSKKKSPKGDEELVSDYASNLESNAGEEQTPTTTIKSPRLQQVKNMDSAYGQKESESKKQSDFDNAKASAKESRKHQDRSVSITSTHSVQSKGMGAGGPLAFTQYQNFSGSEDEEEQKNAHQFDKGIGAHGTPTFTKKPFNNGSVTTWF